MKNSKHLQSILSLSAVAILLSVAYFITKKTEKPAIFITKQQSSINLNNDILSFVNLGQKRLISSLLWISTILESDHDHYQAKDLNSWMFLRFKTISLLEPQFKEVYSFGGPYLSIIKDDVSGASYLYRKGLSLYPDDYQILYNAGFHFYFEVHDYAQSEPIFEKLAQHKKSPLWTLTTLARIKAGTGSKKDALIFLTDFQNKFSAVPEISSKIHEYRYGLKTDLDLECLNSLDNQKCERVDLDGNPYKFIDGHYKSNREYKELIVEKKKKRE